MIVGVALLASLVYGSVQETRIAYIAVRTDKDVYSSDENVTFELVPLTEGVQFTMDGWKDPYRNGVHVVRIPDNVDPSEVVSDPLVLDRIRSWDRERVILPVETFNSSHGPLEMSWNGTMEVMNEMAESTQWAKATSGYYLLLPMLQWSYGHVTKFMLDDAAVFYYDSINVDINTVRTDDSFSLSMDISLGKGLPEGEYELRSRLQPMRYDVMEPVPTYFNKNISLAAGKAVRLELGPVEADRYNIAEFDAVLVGPDGQLFAFGIVKGPDGGWYDDFRY